MARVTTMRKSSPKSNEWRGQSDIRSTQMYDLAFYTGVMLGTLQSAKSDFTVRKLLSDHGYTINKIENLISELNNFSECFSQVEKPISRTGTR